MEQRHPIPSANSGVELMDLCGHLSRRKPDSQGWRVGKRPIEGFARGFDDSKFAYWRLSSYLSCAYYPFATPLENSGQASHGLDRSFCAKREFALIRRPQFVIFAL